MNCEWMNRMSLQFKGHLGACFLVLRLDERRKLHGRLGLLLVETRFCCERLPGINIGHEMCRTTKNSGKASRSRSRVRSSVWARLRGCLERLVPSYRTGDLPTTTAGEHTGVNIGDDIWFTTMSPPWYLVLVGTISGEHTGNNHYQIWRVHIKYDV